MSTTTTELDERIKADLAEIDFSVASTVHLADLIRAGSKSTTQARNWGAGESACALSAAALAAKNLGLIEG